MKNLPEIWDGDDWPIYPFRFRDDINVTDMSLVAVEFYIYDRDGTFLARRPGTVVDPKSSGVVNLMLLSRDTDWDGYGRTLIIKPKVYMALSAAGGPAVNLLQNSSFDDATGSLPARIATGWTRVGVQTATWDNYRWDPWPPAIFGNFQLVTHGSISPLEPDYIQQEPSVIINPGDRLSVGCWHRVDGDIANAVGGAKNDNQAIFYRCGSQTNSHVQLEASTADWYFAKGSVVTSSAESTICMGLDARGTSNSNRYDEAFAFIGAWHNPPVDAKRVVVKPRRRLSKQPGVNQIMGFGSFESDSNSDGLADGWGKYGGINNYYTEHDPGNVYHGESSQRVDLINSPVDFIRIVHRQRFKWGETWQASVKIKTDGPLTGVGGGSGFGIEIQTQYFDGLLPLVSDSREFDTDVATFTEYSTLITMPEEKGELVITIFLAGYTGTVWLDDVQLVQV